MGLSAGSLVSFLVALSFAAGLNIYATTLTLGVLARLHWVALPAGLQVLTNPWVMAAASVLFCCEMFADKIPFVDLVWNFAHTFVRIPLAGLLAYRASSQLAPGMQALVVLAAAGIAAIAHSSKTAARVVATSSPEPFSNIALSAGEDLTSVGLTWVATRHPVGAAIVVGVMVVGAVLAVKMIARALRRQLARLRSRWNAGGATD